LNHLALPAPATPLTFDPAQGAVLCPGPWHAALVTTDAVGTIDATPLATADFTVTA